MARRLRLRSLALAIAVTLMNLIVDIVYAYLDPRVRYT